MDWRKAKTILIVVFIILNIVLAATIYNSLKVEEISQQIITNTSEILEKNNVYIECPIPKYTGRDYNLEYEEKVLDKKHIAKVLLEDNYTQVTNNLYKSGSKTLMFNSNSGFEYYDTGESSILKSYSKSDIDNYLKDLSGQIGIPYDEFKQDGYYHNMDTDDGARLIYKGEFEDYSVFDNYIDIEADKSGIKSIKYHYNKPYKITVKEDIYIMPVYEILVTKMTNYPGVTIKSVDMGFKGYTRVDKETKTLYEGLSWRIKTAEGEEYYFNARNGEEME